VKAGEEGAPAPDDPERRTRRRRRRRRSPRATPDGAGTKERTERSSKGAGVEGSGTGARRATERTEGRKPSEGRSRKQPRRKRSARKQAARKQPARKQPARKQTARKQPGKEPSGKKPLGSKKQAARSRIEDRRLPTQREVSAGGVVYRRGDDGVEVVLASRRTRRGDLAWGLAKGGIERGESREAAAIREVREETGLDAEIEADLGDTRYIYVWEDVRIRKRVHFFLMRHTGGDVDDRDDEMEEVRWFPLERARKRAAYRGERDVLARAAELLT
jgi:8-oxo-dGTP pyrophosphatase MutT (NUDIX family)